MKLLEEAIRLKIGSANAAAFGLLSQPATDWPREYHGRLGHLSGLRTIDDESIFDLASMTKILSTTMIFMKLHDARAVDLTASLSSYLPEVTGRHPHLKNLTLTSLLSHTSGLFAWKPFYETMRNEFGENLPYVSIDARSEKFLELVYSTPLEAEPGARTTYSDLGFIILGEVIKSVTKSSIDQIAREFWREAGIEGFHFRPVLMDAEGERFRIAQSGETVVMTEACPWRGLLQGQVHDDNCWSAGGVTGHTGVFGRLKDVQKWIEAMVSGTWISPSTLKYFSQEVFLADGSGSGRALGFDRPARDGSGSTAFAFSESSIGHLGFTGTSLWLDLDSGFGAVLLTNRVHPDRNDARIRNLRREFHTEIR